MAYANNVINEVKAIDSRIPSEPSHDGAPRAKKSTLDRTAKLIRYANRSLTGK